MAGEHDVRNDRAVVLPEELRREQVREEMHLSPPRSS
jgi:hypothetical protein